MNWKLTFSAAWRRLRWAAPLAERGCLEGHIGTVICRLLKEYSEGGRYLS